MPKKKKQLHTPNPAELIEAARVQVEKEMREVDIMEWYIKEYKEAR